MQCNKLSVPHRRSVTGENTDVVFQRTMRKPKATPLLFGSRPQSEANTDVTSEMKIDDIEEEEVFGGAI